MADARSVWPTDGFLVRAERNAFCCVYTNEGAKLRNDAMDGHTFFVASDTCRMLDVQGRAGRRHA